MFGGSWLKRQARLVRLLVHTRDRTTIEGLLDAVARDGLVLRNARYLDADGQPPLHGEIFIPRERVEFIQVIRGEL